MWASADIVKATGGKSNAAFTAQRIHTDSRTIQPGDLFVPLSGEHFDGHDFIAQAFEKGAVAAFAARDRHLKSAHPLVVVDDVFEALYGLATYNRARNDAKFIGITGSVGKTSTKEMLKLALAKETAAPPAGEDREGAPPPPLRGTSPAGGGGVYATRGNFNNHIGLPLMLANMPMSARFGVFEIGMNHAGEITPLTKLLSPSVAIITGVEAVHLEFFESVEAIADAKAEIMEGLSADGTIILNRDNHSYERLLKAAKRWGIEHIVSFGEHIKATCLLLSYKAVDGVSQVEALIEGEKFSYTLDAVGRHWATTSLSVLAAVHALGADVEKAAEALAGFSEGEGRGKLYRLALPEISSGGRDSPTRPPPQAGEEFTLIDDCYNASPASMNAAFIRVQELAGKHSRSVAVLGDMLELGRSAGQMHAALADGIRRNHIDLVFACGPLMKHLYDALPAAARGGYAVDSASLLPLVKEAVGPGDLVLVKGSNGSKMKIIRDALLAKAY